MRHDVCQFLFSKLCNPKVQYLHVPVRSEHDVLRFNVAVYNTGLVSGGKRASNLDRDLNCFINLHVPARDALTQRLAFD